MPPASRVPGVSRGQVWTEKTAIRLTTGHRQLVDRVVDAAEVVLIRLVAAQEIKALHPGLDGFADGPGLEEEADAEVGEAGVVAAVVEEAAVVVVEPDD